jgi:nucleoside-diphosphate-sugar epimerase
MKTALVTGATGFLGRPFCRRLRAAGWRVLGLARQPAGDDCDRFIPCDLASGEAVPAWGEAVDTVFHFAAKAHALADTAADAAGYERINVEGTRRVVEACGRGGVRALVFVSSIKVFGERQQRPDRGLNESDAPEPDSLYGRSKFAAEGLVLCADAVPHRAVLRPALMYGPGVKGNLARMWAAVAESRFPPLPETGMRRSLVHRDDFCAALELVAVSAAAHNRIFHVTDGAPLSARGVLEAIRAAQGLPPVRFALPVLALKGAARAGDVLGRVRGRRSPLDSDSLGKLIGPAWFDSALLARELGWRARHTFAGSASHLDPLRGAEAGT